MVGRLRAVVHGRVQGVGFRWSTRAKLDELGLQGTATNRDDGTVVVEACGDNGALDVLEGWLCGPQAPGAVSRVRVSRTGNELGY